MRLVEEIDKIKIRDIQTGRASTQGKELYLDDPLTILAQIMTLLSWLRLHPRAQGNTDSNTLPEAKEREGCPQPGLAGKRKAHTKGATT